MADEEIPVEVPPNEQNTEESNGTRTEEEWRASIDARLGSIEECVKRVEQRFAEYEVGGDDTGDDTEPEPEPGERAPKPGHFWFKKIGE